MLYSFKNKLIENTYRILFSKILKINTFYIPNQNKKQAIKNYIKSFRANTIEVLIYKISLSINVGAIIIR